MISFLHMSLWAAVLTAIICFVRAFRGGKLPKRTFRALWAVVILRMLVPLSLPIMKINTDMPLDVSQTENTAVCTYVDGYFANADTGSRILPEITYEVSEEYDRDPPFTIIWLLAAAAVFSAFAAVHIKFRLTVRDALPVETDIRTGFKRKVRIKVSDRIDSPLTYGVFRPVILLPKNIYGCDKKTADYILAHELTHIKRFDVLYKLFMVLAVSMHWFNPLAWVMLVLASRDIELSCDEEVILKENGSREEYALTLIEMEEKRSFGALASGFGGSSVKERIRSVMTVKRTSAAGKAAAVLLVAAAFTVFTVYDIEPEAFYSVTVTEASYNDPIAVSGTYEDAFAAEIAAVPFTAEEIDRALNSAEILVEEAPIKTVEIESAAAEGVYETDDTIMTKTYAITTANGTEIREYPENYSLYNYGYSDAVTGELVIVTIDLNEYSPFDYKKYGLTVSPEKGYYIYKGIPVAGFQCPENTLIDDIAMNDGGGFFIYKEDGDDRLGSGIENGMVQVNTAQFFDITGMH